MSYQLCCPNCGNKDLQITTATTTTTTGKNFSASKGCCGWILLGPIGLLCGACGKGATTTSSTTTNWACPKCGTIFKRPEDIQSEIAQEERLFKITKICTLILAGLTLLLAPIVTSTNHPDSILLAGLFMVVFSCISLACIVFSQKRKITALTDEYYYITRRIKEQNGPSSASTYVSSSSSSADLICKDCGGHNAPGSIYCKLCGGNHLQRVAISGKKQSKSGYCNKCGKEFDPEKYTVFCPHCNSTL